MGQVLINKIMKANLAENPPDIQFSKPSSPGPIQTSELANMLYQGSLGNLPSTAQLPQAMTMEDLARLNYLQDQGLLEDATQYPALPTTQSTANQIGTMSPEDLGNILDHRMLGMGNQAAFQSMYQQPLSPEEISMMLHKRRTSPMGENDLWRTQMSNFVPQMPPILGSTVNQQFQGAF